MSLHTTLVPFAQEFRPVNHFDRVSCNFKRHCSWMDYCTILTIVIEI